MCRLAPTPDPHTSFRRSQCQYLKFAMAVPVPLNSSGKIFDKNHKPESSRGGLVCSLKNHIIRGTVWNLYYFTFHQQTGSMCLADERGQVYYLNFHDNIYESLRLASYPILSLEFIHSRPSNLLVGYANGFTVCIDTITHEISSTLSPRGLDPICLMKCSPSKPLAVLLSISGKLTLWDISQMTILRRMEIPEPVVDIFFLSGSQISVIFETLGAVIYSLSDSMNVIGRCTTPASERKPAKWASSCAMNPTSHPSSSTSCLLLSGDNGSLYLFDLNSTSNSKDSTHPNLCPLVSIVELPPQARMAVAMAAVSPNRLTTLPLLSLVLLLDTREVLLIEGFFHEADSDPWHWRIISSFSQDSLIHTSAAVPRAPRPPFTPRSFPNSLMEYAKGKPNSNDNKHSEPQQLSLPSVYSLCACSSLTDSTRYALIFDGILFVFDWNAVTEEASSQHKHSHCSLHSRTPRGDVPATQAIPTGYIAKLSRAKDKDEEESQLFATTFRLKSRATAVPNSAVAIISQQDEDNEDDESSQLLSSGCKAKAVAKAKSCSSSASTSLFQLIRTSPVSDHLSEPKLRVFLKKFGQYPTRYRPLVWRYLLQLPENEAAFSALCTRQSREGTGGTEGSPVRDRRVSQRLQNVCQLLTLWSPVFGELPYVPQLVFPFSLIFGSDELSCLETVMTLLLWYGHSWQATYPSPPIHITDAYDRLLLFHDPRLHKHLSSLEPSSTSQASSKDVFSSLASTPEASSSPSSSSPGPLAWQLLSTFFSEILPSELWLSLMDRIFTDVRDVHLVYLIPLAILRLLRISLLSTTERRHVIGFLREPQSLQLSPLLKLVSEMKRSTPSHLFSWTSHSLSSSASSSATATSSRAFASRAHPPLSTELEKTHIHLSVAAQEGKPIFPLPKGQYPAYDGFPDHLLDWQVQERARVLSMKHEIQVREDTLLELENQIKEIEREHNVSTLTKAKTKESNAKLMIGMMAREKAYLCELSSLEERITKQRLENLQRMEEMSIEEARAMERLEREAKELLERSESHLKERIEVAMITGRHREVGERAEMLSCEKREKFYLDRWHEGKLNEVTTAIRLGEEEIDWKNKRLLEKWKEEDEENKLERRRRVEEAKWKMQSQMERNLEMALEENTLRLYREQEMKVMEIERQRGLRFMREQAQAQVSAANLSSSAAVATPSVSSVFPSAQSSSAALSSAEARLQEDPLGKLQRSPSNSSSSHSIASASSSSSSGLSLQALIAGREAAARVNSSSAGNNNSSGGSYTELKNFSKESSSPSSPPSVTAAAKEIFLPQYPLQSESSVASDPTPLKSPGSLSSSNSSRDSEDLLLEAQRILDKTESFAATASDLRRKQLLEYVSQLSVNSSQTSQSSDSMSLRSDQKEAEQYQQQQQQESFRHYEQPLQSWSQQGQHLWSQGQRQEQREMPQLQWQRHQQREERTVERETRSWRVEIQETQTAPITAGEIPSKTTRALEKLAQSSLRGLEKSRQEMRPYREFLGGLPQRGAAGDTRDGGAESILSLSNSSQSSSTSTRLWE